MSAVQSKAKTSARRKLTKTAARRKVPTFREGSRKSKVFVRFCKNPEVARKYGLTAGLKGSTLANWFSAWRNYA